MKGLGIGLAVLVLVVPALAAGEFGAPPQISPDADMSPGPDAPLWLAAQDPSQPAGPVGPPGQGPQPPRSPRGMGPGPGAWWKNSEVVKKIELSEAQVAQIEKTFLEHRLRLVDLRAALDKEELRLQPLLDADRPDEAKVATQIDLITAARGKLEKESAMMMLAVRRVLSAEQWKALQALQRERETGPGRPGGPGGPGPQSPRKGPGDPPPAR
jgi:protein CpxP